MANVLQPVVVDLGKAKPKKVKALMLGEGDLVEDVQSALEQIRAGLGAAAEGKRLLPIILVHKRKRSRRYLRLPLPF